MKISILTIAPETFDSFINTPVITKSEKNNMRIALSDGFDCL